MISQFGEKILSILEEAKQPISGQKMAKQLDLSVNTLRNEIAKVNEEAMNLGFYIESKTAAGYYLEKYNEKLSVNYIKRVQQSVVRNSRICNQNSPYVSYLTRRCLCSNVTITIDQLCNELYCSQSTLRRHLDKVKIELEKFNLKLKKQSKNRGITIEGNEWDLDYSQ